MEGLFYRTIGNPKVAEGAHRMVLAVVLAVTTMPKTAISTFPILAALGSVTNKLQILCGWEASLMQKIKDISNVKNKKLKNPGMFQVFFNTLDPNGLPGSATTPSPSIGRYYKLMMTDFAQAYLDKQFWQNATSTADIEIAKKLFNKQDSDTAILTSELLELNSTELALEAKSHFNVENMSEPGSHFSGFDAIRDLDTIINQNESLNEAFLDTAESAGTHQWSDCDLEFFKPTENSPLFRVDGECCLYFDLENNAFCSNPAVNNTARCIIHQDTANSKFMQILAKMSNNDDKLGFSICQSAFRFFTEPNNEAIITEYAPSLEGSLPAFRHSAANMKKLLIAGFQSYKAGYLTKSTIPFKDNFFKEQFPNNPEIPIRKWMHAYISLRVSFRNKGL